MRSETGAEAEALLAFWFGHEPLEGDALARRMRTWFAADPAFDAELRARFAPLVRDAAEARRDAWAAQPRGRLALILLLDQLPRNLYRGEARAFATDARALAWTLSGIEAGLVVPENATIGDAPRTPVRSGDLLGGYADQQFFSHAKTSACPKYHTPAKAPTT